MSGARKSVLIADDSVVFRNYLRNCLAQIDMVDIAGVARDGLDAMAKVEKLRPDVLTLDMEMPGLHGMEVLRRLRAQFPETCVIVIASETGSSAKTTVEALELGAFDFVLKPSASDQQGTASFAKLLEERIRFARPMKMIARHAPRPGAAAHASAARPMATAAGATARVTVRSFVGKFSRPDVVAIGSSTGGPTALHTVINQLPEDFPAPVIITQHMPALFIRSLAERLDGGSKLTCLVAEDGMPLQKGFVLIAPGDMHMLIEKRGMGLYVKLDDGPKVHHCKPAVDPMFTSLAGLNVTSLAVVLTGMGEDGAQGALALSEKRNYVIAQNEESSVVWGMPGATVRAGAAHEVLPLDEIAAAIVRLAMPVRQVD